MNNAILSTQNPQAITYKHEELNFTILGGIRLDGLDRLRVTLKVQFTRNTSPFEGGGEGAAIRHNLDLYNDSQLEKLIRKCAERFEIGTVYIGKAIGELVNQLENWRLSEIKKTQAPEIKKHISEEERKEAMDFLRTPNLLLRTNDLIGKSGVIGEENNRLLMYIIFTSRKREHPLHIISMGSSGAGKSYLQEKIAELIPDEDKDQATSFTENSFYYQGQYDLRNKLLLIEDMDGASTALYPIRELQSKRYIIKKVPYKNSKGETVTKSIRVEGPVCIAGCTTQEKMYEDNANRSFLIYIDESKEQDERIMDYQRKKSAGKINTEAERQAKKQLQNVQRVLQPITVINPYAEYLKIPAEIFKPRRSNAHYLQSIEAITYYKQLQREQKTDESTGEVYIETTIEDIQDANKLMKEILLSKSDELTGACRNYLEELKKYLQTNRPAISSPSGRQGGASFTSNEISKALRIPISTVKRYHLHLFINGYIRHQEKSKGEKSYKYEIISYEEYKELQNRITTALDEALENIKQPLSPSGKAGEGHRLTGSSSAHVVSEPRNKKKVNQLQHQPKKPTAESKSKEKNTTAKTTFVNP